MSDEMDFFIYLLESYADHKGKGASEVMREWDERGITQTIFDGYWGYHTEDIDSLVNTGSWPKGASPQSATSRPSWPIGARSLSASWAKWNTNPSPVPLYR